MEALFVKCSSGISRHADNLLSSPAAESARNTGNGYVMVISVNTSGKDKKTRSAMQAGKT